MSRKCMRCLIEREGEVWKAYCVDVDLAVQGRTCQEARNRLDRSLEQYWYERQDARRGPPILARVVRYWMARLHAYRGARCYDFTAPPDMLVGLA